MDNMKKTIRLSMEDENPCYAAKYKNGNKQKGVKLLNFPSQSYNMNLMGTSAALVEWMFGKMFINKKPVTGKELKNTLLKTSLEIYELKSSNSLILCLDDWLSIK